MEREEKKEATATCPPAFPTGEVFFLSAIGVAIKLIRVAIKLREVGILKRDIQQKVTEWWWGRGMSGGEGVEEGAEGPGREGEGERREINTFHFVRPNRTGELTGTEMEGWGRGSE